MNLAKLKTGFGYQKSSVYACIAEVEEEFSAKLLEQERKAKENEERYLARIKELEKELEGSRSQAEKNLGDQLMIANTLMDAKRYGEALKRETQEQEKTVRRKLDQEREQLQNELDRCGAQIQELRSFLHGMLARMDGEAQEAQEKVDQVNERNLGLFQRRTDREEPAVSEQTEEPETKQ